MRPEIGECHAVQAAILIRVREDGGRHAGPIQILPGVNERALRRLGSRRHLGRLGLSRRRSHRLVPAAKRIHARGEPQGGDGPDQEPGGDLTDRDQSVVARILTCRWLSWFQSACTTPRGPVKPVFGPT